MGSFLKSLARMLFKSESTPQEKVSKGKNFQFATYDTKEDIEDCTWYRLKDWGYPDYYLRWQNRGYGRDWKISSPTEEDVVGVSYEGRADSFVILADQPEFKMYFEREPDNPHDPNAIKVMGSALVNGQTVQSQLGYLSTDTAKLYKDEPELKVGNASVKLPYDGKYFSLKVQILERSKVWKSKQKSKQS